MDIFPTHHWIFGGAGGPTFRGLIFLVDVFTVVSIAVCEHVVKQ